MGKKQKISLEDNDSHRRPCSLSTSRVDCQISFLLRQNRRRCGNHLSHRQLRKHFSKKNHICVHVKMIRREGKLIKLHKRQYNIIRESTSPKLEIFFVTLNF